MGKARIALGVMSLALLGAVLGYVLASAFLTFRWFGGRGRYRFSDAGGRLWGSSNNPSGRYADRSLDRWGMHLRGSFAQRRFDERRADEVW